ncbi:MAG: DNA-3-methyladenine glycosylase [Acidobacteriota bacterium]
MKGSDVPHHKPALRHLKKSDPVMAAIIEQVGPYLIEYREATFQALARAIVYQQLSGKAAGTIFGRLMAAVKVEELTAESILKLRPSKMRTLGLSQQKVDYLRGLARMTRDGSIDFRNFAALEDAVVIEQLTAVKGIGLWTAHMFLMFALRRPDVFPTGDLGIRAAIKRAYNLKELPTPVEMTVIAAPWTPYCSVATWYLWRSLDGEAAI